MQVTPLLQTLNTPITQDMHPPLSHGMSKSPFFSCHQSISSCSLPFFSHLTFFSFHFGLHMWQSVWPNPPPAAYTLWKSHDGISLLHLVPHVPMNHPTEHLWSICWWPFTLQISKPRKYHLNISLLDRFWESSMASVATTTLGKERS